MSTYWLTQYLLAAVGWGYVCLVALALALALWLPIRSRHRVIAGGVVFGLALIQPILGYRTFVNAQAMVDARRSTAAKAKALFEKRCTSAGEKVYRTVENVEAVHLKDVRGAFSASNFRNANWPGAGFPNESSGTQYVMEFLYYHSPPAENHARSLSPTPSGVRGYRYVDVVEGGNMFRYSLRDEASYQLVGSSDPLERYGTRVPSSPPVARYSVVYEDIPDLEGRALWVAGGRVRVVDQLSGETLAEFVRYAVELGQGNTEGGRLPWVLAEHCPKPSYGGRSGHIRSFVEQVIKPRQGE